MTQISYKLQEIPNLVITEINKCLAKGDFKECIEYHNLDKDGYGVFNCTQKGKRKWFKMHRVAYSLFNNIELTSENLVLHSCDNRACCNPHHLRIGTAKDNSMDMVHKGRSLAGIKNPKYRHGKRERSYLEDLHAKNAIKRATQPYSMSKFNIEQLSEIRDRLKRGEKVSDICKYYNAALGTIYNIKNNKTYKHLT